MSAARTHLVSIIELAKGRARSPSVTESEAVFLTEVIRHARQAILELPQSIPPAAPDIEAQLEAAARSDADEVLVHRPHNARAEISDTDPSFPAIHDGESDGVLDSGG